MKLNPVPSLHSEEVCKGPSTIPTPVIHRKLPKKRDFSIDEMQDFKENGTIFSFEELNEKHSPPGFQFRKTDDCVLYYNLQFDEKTSFPNGFECIMVDKEVHVQLQFSGNPLPLPYWFVRGTNAKLSRFGMRINLAPYIRNVSEQNPYPLIEELENRRNSKPKGHPPFSSEMIRYVLLLRYTSVQSYKLLLEKFPLPSISQLNKIQQGGVDAYKAVEILREKREISDEYKGADVEGNLYKGIVALMIQGLKKSISFVIKALPETKITSEWLAQHISECISCLSKVGLNVRAVVTDNYSSNVNAFNCLLYTYETNYSKLFIQHPDNNTKTYLLW